MKLLAVGDRACRSPMGALRDGWLRGESGGPKECWAEVRGNLADPPNQPLSDQPLNAPWVS